MKAPGYGLREVLTGLAVVVVVALVLVAVLQARAGGASW